ncbi:MAG TPA: hypothetical protein VN764_01005 [Polyangiaceae bacterium]|nr:hypothetical protein [Polyangiaceae bacterium]
MPWATCVVVSLGAIWFFGCARGVQTEEQQTKAQEFARLSAALRVLQRAANHDKAAALKRFAEAGCEHLCTFRAACLTAFEQHVAAVGELATLRAQLDDPRSDPALAAQRMLAAEQKLAGAQPLIVECAREQGELGRRF